MSRRKQHQDSEQVVEQFDFLMTEDSAVEELEDGGGTMVRGMKLLGLESRNGRTYDTHGVRSTGSDRLTGARVFLNHPAQATDARRYEDQIGSVVSARYREGQGHFGDVRFNPKHAVYEQLMWDIRNNPSGLGMSINASLKVNRRRDSAGRIVVEGIHSIRSVDIVTHPATTNGVFEHEETDVAELTAEQLLEGLKEHPEILEQLKQDDAAAAEQAKVQQALESAQAELAQIKAEQAEAARLAEVTEQVDTLLKDSPLSGLSEKVVEQVVAIPAEHSEPIRLLLESVVAAVGELKLSRGAEPEPGAPRLGNTRRAGGGNFNLRAELGLKS